MGELLWHMTVLPNSLKLVKVGLPGDPWDGMPEARGVPFFLIEAFVAVERTMDLVTR